MWLQGLISNILGRSEVLEWSVILSETYKLLSGTSYIKNRNEYFALQTQLCGVYWVTVKMFIFEPAREYFHL